MKITVYQIFALCVLLGQWIFINAISNHEVKFAFLQNDGNWNDIKNMYKRTYYYSVISFSLQIFRTSAILMNKITRHWWSRPMKWYHTPDDVPQFSAVAIVGPWSIGKCSNTYKRTYIHTLRLPNLFAVVNKRQHPRIVYMMAKNFPMPRFPIAVKFVGNVI